MLHEGRALSRELVGHRSAWRARRYARVKKLCPFLAMHRPLLPMLHLFVAMLCLYVAMLDLFVAMLCAFGAMRRAF